eukprot:COSAG04_NODE_1170_length_7960_cov_2.783743_8_plen_55_part_00
MEGRIRGPQPCKSRGRDHAEVGDAPKQEVEAMGLEEELLLRLRSLDEVLGSGAT